jgi:hypothetical protein
MGWFRDLPPCAVLRRPCRQVIRNLSDEECMLLFPILKSGVHFDSTPVFFFAKMVTAVNERNGKSEEE